MRDIRLVDLNGLDQTGGFLGIPFKLQFKNLSAERVRHVSEHSAQMLLEIEIVRIQLDLVISIEFAHALVHLVKWIQVLTVGVEVIAFSE